MAFELVDSLKPTHGQSLVDEGRTRMGKCGDVASTGPVAFWLSGFLLLLNLLFSVLCSSSCLRRMVVCAVCGE